MTVTFWPDQLTGGLAVDGAKAEGRRVEVRTCCVTQCGRVGEAVGV